jgi:hypothetical protein
MWERWTLVQEKRASIGGTRRGCEQIAILAPCPRHSSRTRHPGRTQSAELHSPGLPIRGIVLLYSSHFRSVAASRGSRDGFLAASKSLANGAGPPFRILSADTLCHAVRRHLWLRTLSR